MGLRVLDLFCKGLGGRFAGFYGLVMTERGRKRWKFYRHFEKKGKISVKAASFMGGAGDASVQFKIWALSNKTLQQLDMAFLRTFIESGE